MPQPAAKQGDMVQGIDIHIENVPSPSGAIPTPTPAPFAGPLVDGLASTVSVMGLPAAVVGSVARCLPPHIPKAGPFAVPPTMQGTVQSGASAVLVEGRPIARNLDLVVTCTDMPWPLQPRIQASGTVLVGD